MMSSVYPLLERLLYSKFVGLHEFIYAFYVFVCRGGRRMRASVFLLVKASAKRRQDNGRQKLAVAASDKESTVVRAYADRYSRL